MCDIDNMTPYSCLANKSHVPLSEFRPDACE